MCRGLGHFTGESVGESIQTLGHPSCFRAPLQLNYCFQLTVHEGIHLVLSVPQYLIWPALFTITWWVVVRMVFESHQRRFEILVISFTSLCQCLLEDTLMAVGPFYLSDVYARPVQGEVKYPTEDGNV